MENQSAFSKTETKTTTISEFINDEMRALSSVDGPLDDEFLTINALRTCWQFLFLVRSEFLRQCICALFKSSFLDSLQIMGAIIKAVLSTCSFSDIFVENRLARGLSSRRNYGPIFGKAASLSAHETVIYQLEWILQSLQIMDSLPQGQQAQSLVHSLKNITAIIGKDAEISNNDEKIIENPNKLDEFGDVQAAESLASTLSDFHVPADRDTDLQIYEMFTGQEDSEPAKLAAQDSSHEGFTQPEMSSQPLLRELKNAISRRKDVFIEREIVALARLRGVSVEEISREELERPILSESTDLPRDQRKPASRVISCGTFGHKMDANDLAEIMAQRKIFTAVNDGQVLGD